jgi:hypothetical protein
VDCLLFIVHLDNGHSTFNSIFFPLGGGVLKFAHKGITTENEGSIDIVLL